MLENIKQKCVFNAINISLNIISNLNCLMIMIQYFKFIVKFFLKSLISLMILTEINNIKTLIKIMKTMIFIIIVTVF